MATSVTQFGITWTFDADHTIGQYTNGDYYVVAPSGLSITAISPAPSRSVVSSSSVTISQANPAIVTWPESSVSTNQPVQFSTTGELPSPLVAGRTYWVLSTGRTATTARIGETRGGAAIATTSAGSGTHTCEYVRDTNGSMVNPGAAPFAAVGFDSTMNYSYRHELNAGRPNDAALSVVNPMVVPAGSSVISSISVAAAFNRPQISAAAVLTVVASAPPANSFRPPYCGTDKEHRWNKSQINYSALPSLVPTASAPDIASQAGSFERPWIEIDTQYTGRETHPSGNQPLYGRDMGLVIGPALLSLCCNYSNATKETLLVRMLQYGIDIYGAAVSGGNWQANGGHDLGRKAPLVMAALVLGDSAMLTYGDKSQHFIFQEDQQCWYVEQADVGRAVNDQSGIGRPRLTYTQDMVGLPEWGITHWLNKYDDGSNWGVIYRDVCYPPFLYAALAMHLIPGARSAWNWQVWFDYCDRVKSVQGNTNLGSFLNEMWAAYRSLGGPIWSQGTPSSNAPAFTGFPSGGRYTVGDALSLSVTVTGTPTPTLQWRKDGVAINGATSATLDLGTADLAETGLYDCVATNSEGVAVTPAVLIEVINAVATPRPLKVRNRRRWRG